MRIFSLIFALLLITSCSNDNVTNDKYIDQLIDGEWLMDASEKKAEYFIRGIKFSEDSQVFHLDSQGHIIPPHHEENFQINGDTLVIINYKYEAHVIDKKGTNVFLIKKLTDKELELEQIYPEDNKIHFKKL